VAAGETPTAAPAPPPNDMSFPTPPPQRGLPPGGFQADNPFVFDHADAPTPLPAAPVARPAMPAAVPAVRPASRPGAKRNPAVVLVLILVGAVVFLGTGVALAVYCFSGDEKPRADDGPRPPVVENPGPAKENPNPGKDKKKGDKQPQPSPLPEERPARNPDRRRQVQERVDNTVAVPALPRQERERVDTAIKQGVAYLLKKQNDDGTWTPGRGEDRNLEGFKVGYTALAGLTLLECGVKPDDPAIQKTARFIRSEALRTLGTYDLSLAILFLDRLGQGKVNDRDKSLIQKLALRLVAGQKISGGWSYQGVPLTAVEQTQLLALLQKHKDTLDSSLDLNEVRRSKLVLEGSDPIPEKLKNLAVWKKDTTPPPLDGDRSKLTGESDNSNTQFAVLALWVAKKYDVPLERTLALIVKRFQKGQNEDGSWGYLANKHEVVGFHERLPGGKRVERTVKNPTMTCAGLLGLAVGMGLSNEVNIKGGGKVPRRRAADDPKVKAGLDLLGEFIGEFNKPWQKVSLTDLYFMWSVERVAVIYNLPQIGGRNWYAWGAEMLVGNQTKDGNWQNGHYPDSTPVIDTCFALLFLKKANLAVDLTSKLQLAN
jgi:hypothetical protein